MESVLPQTGEIYKTFSGGHYNSIEKIKFSLLELFLSIKSKCFEFSTSEFLILQIQSYKTKLFLASSFISNGKISDLVLL